MSFDPIRVFEFITPNSTVYVAWDADASEETRKADLSVVLDRRVVTGTQLNSDNSLVELRVTRIDTTPIPGGIIPVFIE